MLHYWAVQFFNWISNGDLANPQFNLWHVGILVVIGAVGVIVFETAKYFLEEWYSSWRGEAYVIRQQMKERQEAIESWHKYREANGL